MKKSIIDEEVVEPKEIPANSSAANTRTQINKGKPLNSMSKAELEVLAKEKGFDVSEKKKDEILELLKSDNKSDNSKMIATNSETHIMRRKAIALECKVAMYGESKRYLYPEENVPFITQFNQLIKRHPGHLFFRNKYLPSLIDPYDFLSVHAIDDEYMILLIEDLYVLLPKLRKENKFFPIIRLHLFEHHIEPDYYKNCLNEEERFTMLEYALENNHY